jgi:hypothetical protein
MVSKLRAKYFEYERGGRRFLYLITNDLLRELRKMNVKNSGELEIILSALGYDAWLKPEEARSLIDLARSNDQADSFTSHPKFLENHKNETEKNSFEIVDLTWSSDIIETVPPEMRTFVGGTDG